MVSGFHSRTARPDRLKGTGDIPHQRYQGMLPCTLVTICKVRVRVFGLPRGPTRRVKPPKDVFSWDLLIAASLGPILPLLLRLWTKKGPIPCESKVQDYILGLPQGPTRRVKPPKDVFWWDQLIAVSLGPKLPLLIRLWTKKGPIPSQSKVQDCILGLPQGPTRRVKTKKRSHTLWKKSPRLHFVIQSMY